MSTQGGAGVGPRLNERSRCSNASEVPLGDLRVFEIEGGALA